MPDAAERAPAPARSRRTALLQWAVGLAVLVWLFRTISVPDLASALGRAPLALFGLVTVGYVVCTLLTDSFASWVTFRRALPDARIGLAEMIQLRGGSYVLGVVHYAVGQGGLAWLIHRRMGVPVSRAAGAVVLTLAVNTIMVTLSAFAGIALGGAPDSPTLHLIVLALACGAPAYLGVLAARPGFLVRRSFLKPLFDAGVRGHALTIVARLPHIAVLILGNWLAMRLFGVTPPLGKAMALLPLVFVVGVLPISPAGLGTAQATAVALFTPFAAGAALADRQANVLAYSLGLQMLGLIVQAVIGLALMRRSLRRPAAADTVGEKAPSAR